MLSFEFQMEYLIKQVEIFDKNSPFHQKRADLYLKNGIIKSISPQQQDYNFSENILEINAQNCKASIGWFDMSTHIPEPDQEHKETFVTASQSAMFGGFTEVVVLPNANPVIQDKKGVDFVKNQSQDVVSFHPMASVTRDVKGKEITEMIDLYFSGAVAFSDGLNPIWHPDILIKTLLYLQKFDGLLINRPEETLLTNFGQMHEGATSTMLGLKGLPALAEELMIQRDLKLLEYTGGKIHFSMISAAKSVELIRNAKRQGLQVTCDIASHQLAFEDKDLMSFDTNLKVKPPFRTREDIEALEKGLLDGTIDVIVSGHTPQDEESKNLEFDLAEFGILGLETSFAVANTYTKQIPLKSLIEKLTYQPREILNLKIPEIKEGEIANLTLFDENLEWTYKLEHIKSMSKNSPFIDKKLKGKALAVFNNHKFYIDEKIIN